MPIVGLERDLEIKTHANWLSQLNRPITPACDIDKFLLKTSSSLGA